MLKFIRLAIFFGPILLFNYIKTIKYSRNPAKYPYAKRYKLVRKVILRLVKVLRVSFNIEGLEHLDANKQQVIYANHRSMFDIITLMAVIEKPITFVSKKEVTKYPFVGRYIRAIETLLLDRDDLRQSLQVMKQASELVVNENRLVAIFPEGTRSKDGKVGDFKAGAFMVAKSSKANILPISLTGSEKPLNKKFRQKTYVVNISISSPFEYEHYRQFTSKEITDKVQEIVQNNLKNE